MNALVPCAHFRFGRQSERLSRRLVSNEYCMRYLADRRKSNLGCEVVTKTSLLYIDVKIYSRYSFYDNQVVVNGRQVQSRITAK